MDDKLKPKYRIRYWIPGGREDVFFDDWNKAMEAKMALQKVQPSYIFEIEEVID